MHSQTSKVLNFCVCACALCMPSAPNPPTLPSDKVPKSRPEHPRGLTCSLSTLLFSSSARLRSSSSFRRLSSSSSRLFSSCSLLRCSRSCCLLASRSLLCCCKSQDGTSSADCPVTVPRTACCPLTGRCESGNWGTRIVSRLHGHGAQDNVLSTYSEMRERELGDPASTSQLFPHHPVPTHTSILITTGQSWVSF